MAVSSVSGVTSTYSVRTTSVSSTTPSSCTTAVSSTTATSSTTSSVKTSASTTSTTVNYASATAKATSSTTISYSGSASSTAKVSSTTSTSSTTATSSTTPTSSTTASASTTASVTPVSVETSGSGTVGSDVTTESLTTSYPYLAHLGDEGIKDLETALVNLGFDDGVDGDFLDGLTKFRNLVGMENYGLYSEEVVSRLSEVSNNESSIRARFGELDFTYDSLCEGLESFKTMMEIEDGNDVLAKLDEVIENSKTWLEELGFYNRDGGEFEIENLQAEGASDVLNTSLVHFYAVYSKEYAEVIPDEYSEIYRWQDGEDYSGKVLGETYKKLENVYKKYKELTKAIDAGKFDDVFETMEFKDDRQKTTFALTWTFLREGMGLTVTQAAGMMGNIGWEARFSTINAQETKGYPGVFDPEYEYETENEVGYGLLQWTEHTRKENLLSLANEMGLTVSNINVQFACMRDESYNYYYQKNGWDTLKDVEGVESIGEYEWCDLATQIGKDGIEWCDDDTLSDRKEFTHTIYDTMLTILNEGVIV